MNSSFIEGILKINADYYYSFNKEDEQRFRVIAGYVFCYASERVYDKLVREKEIDVLENLPQLKKEKYWRLANMFCQNSRIVDRVIASKAAYILELITATYEDELPKLQAAENQG